MTRAAEAPPSADGPRPEIDLHVLDGIRGLAAAYVMIGHARWLLWEGHASFLRHAKSEDPLARALAYSSAVFRFGHEAVILFFVLSGLVIHLRYARELRASPAARFDLVQYLRRRARRLYPPLLLAIAVTWMLDGIGMRGAFPIYQGRTPYPMIDANVAVHRDGWTLLGNLSFLMDTYVPAFGTNGPLWSLKYEAWFYLSYPLLWLLARRCLAAATGLLALMFALSAWPATWPSLLAWQVASKMLIWWLGAILAEGIAGRVTLPWGRVALLALLLPVLPFLEVSEWTGDLLWGLAFFGGFAALFALQSRGWRFRALGRLGWLGAMSYTLYVTHFPVIALMSGWLMSRSQDHRLPTHFGWVFTSVVACGGFAYVAHLMVERPFAKAGSSRRRRSGP